MNDTPSADDDRAYHYEPGREYWRHASDRYSQLPEWKRRWIEDLSEEDQRWLDILIEDKRAQTAVKGFLYKVVAAIAGILLGIAAFGDHIMAIVRGGKQ
jgi:hypothetical protein